MMKETLIDKPRLQLMRSFEIPSMVLHLHILDFDIVFILYVGIHIGKSKFQ